MSLPCNLASCLPLTTRGHKTTGQATFSSLLGGGTDRLYCLWRFVSPGHGPFTIRCGFLLGHFVDSGSMVEDRLDEAWVNLQDELPKDASTQVALAMDFCNRIGLAAKVDEPVGSLSLPLNGIRQPTFFPKPADDHFAIEIGNNFLHFSR